MLQTSLGRCPVARIALRTAKAGGHGGRDSGQEDWRSSAVDRKRSRNFTCPAVESPSTGLVSHRGGPAEPSGEVGPSGLQADRSRASRWRPTGHRLAHYWAHRVVSTCVRLSSPPSAPPASHRSPFPSVAELISSLRIASSGRGGCLWGRARGVTISPARDRVQPSDTPRDNSLGLSLALVP
jgi:hypothetical protein